MVERNVLIHMLVEDGFTTGKKKFEKGIWDVCNAELIQLLSYFVS